MAIDQATRQRIQSDYPAFAALLDIPEVANLLGLAAKEGWDIGKLQANLYATTWWKGHTESQRNAQILWRTDRASYERNANQIRANIRDEANRLGARLSNAEVLMLSRLAYNGGWTAEEITRNIVATGRRRSWGAGEITRMGGEIIALSRQYGIPVSKGWADTFASRIAWGEKSMDAIRVDFAERTKAKYAKNSQVVKGIDAGLTLQEIVEPTLNLFAEELELGNVQWDLNTGSANKMINYKDVDTGELRIMTDSEAMQLARSDRRWRDTNRSKAVVTDATNAIARFMGAKV